MADDNDHRPSYLVPSRQVERVPTAPLPMLPASGSRRLAKRIAKDEAAVRAHASWLAARREQHDNAVSLARSRLELERAIAQLAALPLVLEHDLRMGIEDRRHEYAMRSISHQTSELAQRAQLLTALNYERSLAPQPEPQHHNAPTSSADPAELDSMLANFPELAPETRKTLGTVLRAWLSEKRA